MKKLMLLTMLIAINAVAHAQAVTFTQLFSVFSGGAKASTVFSSAQKQQLSSAVTSAAQRIETFKLNEGQASEATILTGQGMVKNATELKPELTFLTKDSTTMVRLKTEIIAAGFVLDSQKEVMGAKSFTYSKGKNSVWISISNNGACIVKLLQKS